MIHIPLRPKPYPDQDVMGVYVGKKKHLAWVSLVSTVAFLPIERSRSGVDGSKRFPLVYVKVHPAVILATCSCGAKPTELCIARDGERMVGCHADRKDEFYRQQKARR